MSGPRASKQTKTDHGEKREVGLERSRGKKLHDPGEIDKAILSHEFWGVLVLGTCEV